MTLLQRSSLADDLEAVVIPADVFTASDSAAAVVVLISGATSELAAKHVGAGQHSILRGQYTYNGVQFTTGKERFSQAM